MNKTVAFIPVGIWLLFISAGFISCQEDRILKDLYPISELKEDFNELREILENEHPGIYYYETVDEKERYFDSLFSLIDKPMTELEFLRFIAPVISETKCGHTIIEPSLGLRRHINANARFFPFEVYFNKGKTHIYKGWITDTRIKSGTEILKINSKPVEEIFNLLLNSISADGYNTTFKVWNIHRDFPRYYYKYVDTSSVFKLELIFPGEEQSREASVGGISPRKIPRRDYRFYYPALNHERNIRNFKIIDSLNTAILSFSTFDDFGGVSLDHFIDRSFEKIIESGVTSLIIDLRGNTGGPPDPSLNLLSHLVEEPFTYFWKPSRPFSKYNYLTYPHSDLFTGDLYVLINGGCFSTTGHFLSHLSYFKRGILIGEESGGSFSCNDNSEEHNLSNTGIYLRYARTSFVTYKDAFERGRGIFPDVEVIPTIVDILNERDVVMEEALKMIGGKLKN